MPALKSVQCSSGLLCAFEGCRDLPPFISVFFDYHLKHPSTPHTHTHTHTERDRKHTHTHTHTHTQVCKGTHISGCDDVIAKVTAQPVSGNVGEQRGPLCRRGSAGRSGLGRGSRRGGRGGVYACSRILIGWGVLQAVSHDNKGVEAQSCVHHQL